MKNNRIFWGSVFLLSALFLVINQLGYFGDFSGWTILFTVFLIAIIIKSIYPVRYSGLLFPLAFLYIIYAEPLGIVVISPWLVLVIAGLANVGLSMLIPEKRYKHIKKQWDNGVYTMEFDDVIIDHEDGSYVEQSNSFSGATKYVNSTNFKRANLNCKFGALKVYFNNVSTQEDKVFIQINASFSGVELFIPKEWRVEERINASFGGIDYKNRPYADDKVTVVLVGEVSFAGVEIIYI